jgi:hypothetical protein
MEFGVTGRALLYGATQDPDPRFACCCVGWRAVRYPKLEQTNQ